MNRATSPRSSVGTGPHAVPRPGRDFRAYAAASAPSRSGTRSLASTPRSPPARDGRRPRARLGRLVEVLGQGCRRGPRGVHRREDAELEPPRLGHSSRSKASRGRRPWSANPPLDSGDGPERVPHRRRDHAGRPGGRQGGHRRRAARPGPGAVPRRSTRRSTPIVGDADRRRGRPGRGPGPRRSVRRRAVPDQGPRAGVRRLPHVHGSPRPGARRRRPSTRS